MTQSTKVRWEGEESEIFKIKNGVKQGGVLSAILFCIYINYLIKEMRKNRDGCWKNNEYVRIFTINHINRNITILTEICIRYVTLISKDLLE